MISKIPKNKELLSGILLLGSLLTLMLFPALWKGMTLNTNMENRFMLPCSTHYLGTDNLGRDLLSCMVYGTGLSLLISLSTVLFSALLGGTLGIISGLSNHRLNNGIIVLINIFMAFPSILIMIYIGSISILKTVHLISILIIFNWMEYARLIRSEVLKIKQTGFIIASQNCNAPGNWIIIKQIFPMILPLLIVQAGLAMPGIILWESSLNFLGLGLPPNTPTLGQLINSGRIYLFNSPYLLILPGSALTLMILSFNVIGEGIKKKFIP